MARGECLLALLLLLCRAEEYEYEYGDEEPPMRNCSTAESITGGTVELPGAGAAGTLMLYRCPPGFRPFPVAQRSCSPAGVWEPKVSRPRCEEWNDYDDHEDVQNCSLDASIQGGSVRFSASGQQGSVLSHHCPPGHYPFPSAHRVCLTDGRWSAMTLPSGQRTHRAVCKEVLCPAQVQLDHGQFWPRRQWFRSGETQWFQCQDGFVLLGSSQRNCTQQGVWTGTSPVCDDQAEDCRNPGSPAGALRSGKRFQVGDRVRYRCQAGLDLLGSSERRCLSSREWSGVEPRCYARYVFDSAAGSARTFGGSLSALMDVSQPEFKRPGESFGRSLRVAEGRLNVFVLLDTSGSISPESFQKAKQAVAQLIQKLDSYEVNIRFDIISFASEAKDIVSIDDADSGNVNYVLQRLRSFSGEDHGRRRGTNLYDALQRVYLHLAVLKEKPGQRFNQTQNVVLIATDGHSNIGPSPRPVLARIRQLLGYRPFGTDHTLEPLLDVYVFAVGRDVNRNELQHLASWKKEEQHIFLLENYTQLGVVFSRMISDSAVTKCGVAHEEEEGGTTSARTRPWHVDVVWERRTCRGSLVTQMAVLSAAHCFITLQSDLSVGVARAADVTLRHGGGEVKVQRIHLHPRFNVSGLRGRGLREFYDYDVALVMTTRSISISSSSRPVCLPCTVSANHALRLAPDASCQQHEQHLLRLEETPVQFIKRGKKRCSTYIHTGGKRESCIQAASSIIPVNSSVSLTDVISPRLLCSGASNTRASDVTCKGDSGGAVFLHSGLRVFQVAVVSWGTAVCDALDTPPPHARDFHISVFAVMDWLRRLLGHELHFLPPGGAGHARSSAE